MGKEEMLDENGVLSEILRSSDTFIMFLLLVLLGGSQTFFYFQNQPFISK